MFASPKLQPRALSAVTSVRLETWFQQLLLGLVFAGLPSLISFIYICAGKSRNTDLIETSGNVDGVIGGHDAEALTEPGQRGSHGPGVCGGVVNLEQKPGPSGLWAFFPNPRPFFRDFCTQMEWLGFCLLFPTTLYHCVIRE